MKRKKIIWLFLLCLPIGLYAQLPDLVEMEYYFDTDPGFGNGFNVPFAADSLIDVDFNADLSSIDVGYHKFYVRIKDENSRWSTIYKQNIFKESNNATSVQPLPDLVQMEYYFDNDPGFGNGFNVPFAADSLIDVDFNADLSSIDVGYHKFYVRIKDENGIWSIIYKENIFKESNNATSVQPLPDLVEMEYYFDTDPGFGNGFNVPFAADSLIDVDFNADLSSIDVGYHKFYVRIKDENGKWSTIYKENIFKEDDNPASENPLPDLVEMEYYFDNDPGFGNGFDVPFTADSLIDVDFNADLSSIDVGYHKFYVRIKDENGKWSTIYKQNIYKNSTPAGGSDPLPDIVKVEYFFDADPGYGQGTDVPLTSDSLIELGFNADMNALAAGDHWLYVRVLDENGRWSLILAEEVERVNANNWTGLVDTDWNKEGNWDSGVPTDLQDVSIDEGAPRYPDQNSGPSAACQNLFVNPSASLSIPEDQAITVHADLSVSGTLKLESGATGSASLINMGSITSTGNVQIERYISQDEWHLISTPVSDGNAEMFSGDFLQYYDGGWNDITDASSSLAPLQAYSFWSVVKSASYTFEGAPNTGDLSRSIHMNDNGWNLFGNPYPSAIDWSMLDGTYGAVYYWNPSLSNYQSWIDGGEGSQYVPSMQGFWIKATTAGTFSVNNSHRTHTGNNQYYKEESSLPNAIDLEVVSENGMSDQLFINLKNEASPAFDLTYDAWKLFTPNESVPQLYSYHGNDIFSIDRRPSCLEIPLGFRCGESGTFRIKLNRITDLDSLVLEDLKLNAFHEFNNGDYVFDYEAGEASGRFKLHLNTLGNDEINGNKLQVYALGQSIVINSQDVMTKAELEILDVAGKKLGQYQLPEQQNYQLRTQLPAGIYILKLQTNTNQLTKKIIIK